jgi:cell wall-associated NlpC family hydrolase
VAQDAPSSSATTGGSTFGTGSTATGSTGASGYSGATGSTGSVSAPASASAQRVIDIAKTRIGAPYVYGASGPSSFDCSGFTSWVFAQVGIGLPRTAQEQWLAGPHVSYADAQPGDILAWAGDSSAPGYVTHVAIYLGNGQMISAPHTGATVGISSVYTSGLLGAVRVLS